MTYLAGKIAFDINAGAPNNGEGEDQKGRVKQMRVGRDVYPYIAPQAVRRWLRDSVPASEPRSRVFRTGSGQKQQAFTQGRPDKYLDDDLFGYMVALKDSERKKGPALPETCQRDTVLATGTFVAVVPNTPTMDFGTMTRGFDAGDNPVIHQHEFYTAVCTGDVLLDLPRVGVFETDGGGLKVALGKTAAQEAKEAGATETTLRGTAALALPIEERRRRTALILRSLATIQGGAKHNAHYGDRTPAFLVLAPMKGGNNPFTRLLQNQLGKVTFATTTLEAEITAWEDQLDGPVRIGWAPGFLADQREKAITHFAGNERVTIGHPRTILNTLADEITDKQHDDWFQDAQ
ncbi:type I-B CRISPR-associated protein Cas7/Cst2/DevR [Streptomyces lydicus]|uniref:type I-B CRISPR-associated protein Cas7/Cst2/DevR n=1 Tax=Streptomyces lydicus TaxID=47763 RepID=UPI0037A935DA